MKSSALQPVRFVDDGHPESSDYANNYVDAVMPHRPRTRRSRAHRQTTLRAVWRLLRRRAHAANRRRRGRRMPGLRPQAGVGHGLNRNLA